MSSPKLATPPKTTDRLNFFPAKSWTHFVAGGLGGMCGAIITSPLDVVKTRLQSSMFVENAMHHSGGTATVSVIRSKGLLWSFVETGHILRDIYTNESPAALFKGLGPTLVGVVPARSLNFFTYGNGKQIIANHFNNGQESSVVYLAAAVLAGVVTGTATNPIWVVKTRMQLSASQANPYRSSWPCITQIMREEGIRGFYRGLTASYLGVTETTIQWVIYENLKKISQNSDSGRVGEFFGIIGSSGASKMVASLITYPHEVIRTRLRQPSVNGVVKYKGLWQTLRLVIAEEGAARLYGGLSAHLLRVVPNAAVMFTIYEGILRWNGQS
ncbi:mitochondrial carrier [Sistotremastrum suecicum HHB10207 ss-3]|uniref:Mitochondrial carrier n=1 Tax=Sistotremastrum suecicum HHB10207 ss-3 TaxID=1314776 RepID=A0A166HUE8_9AGAM|nr:mitochondrial carrier [Sistotremastrum suecicum HHB10207 ss-3]